MVLLIILLVVGVLAFCFFKRRQIDALTSEVKEVNKLLEKKAYFDALEKIISIEKKGAEIDGLTKLKRLTVTAIAAARYAEGSEHFKNKRYAEASESLEGLRKLIVSYPESFGLDMIKVENFFLDTSREFQSESDKVLSGPEVKLIRDKWQEKAKAMFEEEKGTVVQMLIDSVVIPLVCQGQTKTK